MTEETADAWIAAWEAQAAEDGLERGSEYWQAGWEWIAGQRKHRARPEAQRGSVRDPLSLAVGSRHGLLTEGTDAEGSE